MSKIGTCQLTGCVGKLVNAHIIPDALTKPDEGRFWIETGSDQRPLRRWTSWYDNELVTREGEAILAKLDDEGIRVLRAHQLVWSGFKSDPVTFGDWVPLGNSGQGTRIIEGIDGRALRLFLLSILWRAGASRRPEFRQIRISQGKLKLLGGVIKGDLPDRRSLSPIAIVQISSRGERHNFAPRRETKILERNDGRKKIPFFRFFFDGLVVHFHVKPSLRDVTQMGLMEVGRGNKLGVLTIPYELSAQMMRLEGFKDIAGGKWPKELSTLAVANWRKP